MKKLLFLVLLFFIQNAAFSQDCDSLDKKIESLFYKGDYKGVLKMSSFGIDSCAFIKSNDSVYRYWLCLKAACYTVFGYNDSAVIIFKEVIIEYNKTHEPDALYASYLTYLSVSLTNIGKYSEAIDSLNSCLKIYSSDSITNIKEIASVYGYLANAYKGVFNFRRALYYSNMALMIKGNIYGVNSNEYSRELNSSGAICIEAGDIENAIKYLEQSALIAKKYYSEADPTFVGIKNNLSVLYSSMGNDKQALELMKNVVSNYKKSYGDNSPLYARGLSNLAISYIQLKQFDSAKIILLESVEILRTRLGENNDNFANCLNNLAIVYQNTRKYEDAIKLYSEAIRINKGLYGNNNSIIAKYLSNLSNFYDYIGNRKSAIEAISETISIYKSISMEDTQDFSESLIKLSQLYKKSDMGIKANELFVASLKIYRNQISKNLTLLNSFRQLKYIYGFDYAFQLYEYFLNSETKNFSISEAFSNSLFLKSLSLNETKKSLQAMYNSSDTAVQNMFQNLSGIKNYLSKQYTLPLAKQAPDIKDKETEAQDIEQQLAIKSADFRRYEQSINITTSDVYKALKPGEAAIEFTSFHYYGRNGWTDSTIYAAIVLTAKDSVPKWVYLFEEKQIKQLLFNVHPNLLYTNAKIIQTKQPQYGDKLYNLIWKKTQPWLTGISTVYFSPSGILNQVALDAIPFAGGTATIGNTYRLVQMGSTKNIVVQEPAMPLKDIALMGGIQYNADSASFAANITDSGLGNANIYTTTIMRAANKTTRALDYLPATLTEVDSITATATTAGLGAQLYTNTTATEEMLKSLSGHSPSILHLATHGFYVPYTSKKANDDIGQTSFSLIDDPMLRSGIALAGANLKWNKNIDVPNREDGIVTAYEIAQMDLSKTELVVLSACESGLGDIDGSEGVFGLQRGFKSAGVNKLILTLWQVPDKASMQFMTEFYKNWLIQHKEMRTAFWQAQQTMKKIYPKEPSKWAGFILVE